MILLLAWVSACSASVARMSTRSAAGMMLVIRSMASLAQTGTTDRSPFFGSDAVFGSGALVGFQLGFPDLGGAPAKLRISSRCKLHVARWPWGPSGDVEDAAAFGLLALSVDDRLGDFRSNECLQGGLEAGANRHAGRA